MLEAQTADIRALLFLSPSPPTFQDFKEAWRSRRFSLIHDACPAGVDRRAYTQTLFNAALACLGSRDKEPGAASDEAVLFALLLLFHTQRCEPRVQVYLPLRKLLRIACIAQSAAEREDAELLTVLRTLLSESALVAGAAELSRLPAKPQAAAAASPTPGAAAADHLATSLDAARDFASTDSVASLAAAYALAARPCGLNADATKLLSVLQGTVEALQACKAESERAERARREAG